MTKDYNKICDFNNLYLAHKRSRKGKRNKREVLSFESNLAYELNQMVEELREGRYRFSGYYHFTIWEPKKREIYAGYYRDRVLQHALCDEIIKPLMEKRLIYDNAACREGKGTHFAGGRLTLFMRKMFHQHGKSFYILKGDIKQYFPSISHQVLKEKLTNVIKDFRVRKLLFELIDTYELTEDKGLPLGNQTSQWFAIYYLDSLDRLIKEKLKIRYYSRYMDDFLLLHEDKEYLQYCLMEIQNHVEQSLKLRLNQKTEIIPARQGVSYLGFRYLLTANGKVIRRQLAPAKKRMKQKLKKLKWEYHEGTIELENIKQSLAGFTGHLKHGHTYQLRKAIFKDFVLTR
ncbi:RNA-directed DNA polymerase [Lachnospiraceae bacterium PF1-21]